MPPVYLIRETGSAAEKSLRPFGQKDEGRKLRVTTFVRAGLTADASSGTAVIPYRVNGRTPSQPVPGNPDSRCATPRPFSAVSDAAPFQLPGLSEGTEKAYSSFHSLCNMIRP